MKQSLMLRREECLNAYEKTKDSKRLMECDCIDHFMDYPDTYRKMVVR